MLPVTILRYKRDNFPIKHKINAKFDKVKLKYERLFSGVLLDFVDLLDLWLLLRVHCNTPHAYSLRIFFLSVLESVEGLGQEVVDYYSWICLSRNIALTYFPEKQGILVDLDRLCGIFLDISMSSYHHKGDKPPKGKENDVALEGTENYKVWSAAVQLALHTRNKIGFINGKYVRDENSGPLQEQWDRCNAVVLSCYTLTQFGMSLSEYYHECNALWRQFNALIDLPGCSCDAAPKVKGHKPLPDVKSTFATLSRLEYYRNSNVSYKSVKSRPAAFAARPSNGNNWNSNRNGHTIDRCFELVGYPLGFKRSNTGQNNSNNAASNDIKTNHSKSAPNTLTSDQYQRLMALLSDTSNASKTHASVAGTFMINNTIIDSEASQHITFCYDFLFDIMDVTELNLTVSHLNGTLEHVKQIGSYKLGNNLVIKDGLVVLGYHVSLMSVHKLSRDNKVIVIFNDSKCKIQDLTQKFLMGTGSERGGLYFFDEGKRVNNSNIKCCHVSTCIWHNRLGHPSDQVLTVLKDKINDLNQTKFGPCEICHKAKQTKEPFPISDHKTSNLGDLVHLDVWGHYKVRSRDGFKYFLTVVDDYTRAVWVFLMQSKTEVFDNISEFYNLIKNQFNKSIKIFRSDNGTEFVNKKFETFVKSNGIIHQTSNSYTLQQNGVAERKHRHLLNTTRALMVQGGLPLNMWPESVLTATYLINKLPTTVLSGKSPYESDKCVFVGYAFDKKGYKLFSLNQKKFIFSRDVKFYENVFPFKYNSFTTKYVMEENGVNDLNFFNETSDSSLRSNEPNDDGGDSADNGNKSAPNNSTDNPSNNTIDDVAKDLDYMQTDNSNTANLSGIALSDDDYESEGEDIEYFGQLFESPEPAVGQPVRRSSRKSSMPSKYKDYVLNKNVKYGIDKVVNYSHPSIENFVYTTSLNKIHEPSTYAEVVKENKWVEAMNQEIEAFYRNETWSIIDLCRVLDIITQV
ncbi:putative RNA-directed DNA polymerase [Tanacetum coccineum]|uniref:RNA-directed DNA polymerase n=1 Tax=Tanacetum coccineum TaxID=301880 RepID=A0ABQ4WZF9_9ASTR